MTNRISQYDAGQWLALLIQQKLVDYGEPVVAIHEAMRQSPETCKFEDENEEYN
jgi:hypothetical protein